MTELEKLKKEFDNNIKMFYSGELTYEEFHWVQRVCLEKIKKLEEKK